MRGMFFTLSSWQLGLLVFAVIGGACVIGALAGRYVRKHSDTYREPIGAVQGALLGLVGLILAFGLSLAVGRYQDRRADVVNDANTIGTAYLRAQTIAEPQRSDSLALLRTLHRSRDPCHARGPGQLLAGGHHRGAGTRCSASSGGWPARR